MSHSLYTSSIAVTSSQSLSAPYWETTETLYIESKQVQRPSVVRYKLRYDQSIVDVSPDHLQLQFFQQTNDLWSGAAAALQMKPNVKKDVNLQLDWTKIE